MKIAFFPNFSKDHTLQVLEDAIALLQNDGSEILLEEMSAGRISPALSGRCVVLDRNALFSSCDVIVAIGGDGTMIHCAAEAASFGKPVMGINTGRLGYVTEIEKDELYYLKKLESGDYSLENRMMLSVEVTREGKAVFCEDALNDAVITRGSLSRIVDFQVRSSQDAICRYRADGLIFSTPTGSTAYSFSAGGPVVEPTLECILLVPVCPHALSARPFLFPSTAVLTASAESADHDVYLTVDGSQSFSIQPGDRISVKKSERSVTLVRIKKKDFCSILNEKLAGR